MVSKDVLKQYTDLQNEIQEINKRIADTERRLSVIESEGTVIDSVKGGMGGIQHFRIEGFPDAEYGSLKSKLRLRQTILKGKEAALADKLNEIELFLSQIEDSRMRRIIALRFIDGLTWEQVGRRMGGGNNADSVKQAFHRFMANN